MILQDLKLLITGASGFFGRNLTSLLDKNGISYVGVCSDDGDLREWNSWSKLIDKYQPTGIIHLAARSGGIKGNLKRPFDFYYDNLAMLTNLTRMLNNYQFKKVIVPIGGCSYPADAESPIAENILWRGFPHKASAPFSSVKLLTTVLPQVFQSQKINIIIPGNMYGPYDNYSLEDSHVIPGMIRKFYIAKTNGLKEVVLWGSGLPIRDFVYSEDICQATLDVLFHSNCPEVLNLSTGIGTRLRDLAIQIREIMEYDGDIVWNSSEPEGQMTKIFDTDRAASTGIFCKTDLKTGLQRTINWFYEAVPKGAVRF